MSEYAIAQRETFIEGPQASPAIYTNMARYQTVAFYGTVTKVEASGDDGVTWIDITTLATVTVPGVALLQDAAFRSYKVTGSTLISVNAT